MTFPGYAPQAPAEISGHWPSIRGVLFDVDGTLYRQSRLRALMAAELLTLPLMGLREAPRRWRALQAFRAAQERLRASHPPLAGRSLSALQAQSAADAAGLSVAEAEALVAEWIHRRPLKYLRFCRARGLTRLLDTIARTGRRAGGLSDYPAEAKLQALGLEGRLAPVVCASDEGIGSFKPSPSGYLHVCKVWGLPPEEVLFVGDRADVDAVGAAAAGMPCAIVGRRRAPAGASYAVVQSLEQLTRVFDDRA